MLTTLTGDIADNATHPHSTTTTSAPRRDTGLAGQLNLEWARLRGDENAAAAVTGWANRYETLAGCATPADVEQRILACRPEETDQILLALLRLARSGDALAGRTVLQLMLGKAIRIAASRSGMDTRHNLEHTTITALWTVIATYPVDRRPTKVAANIAMDTLQIITGEFAHHRTELPTGPDLLNGRTTVASESADVELLEVLTWSVDRGTISAADATLILDIYSPAPGEAGGATAAARHGLGWPAARQRASRAVRKIATAIHGDSPTT